MIAIIDYDAGNSHSVAHACSSLGYTAHITADPRLIETASKLIFPGQGAFSAAMQRLRSQGLIDSIHRCIQKNTPFLGICLGFQLLFESSDEHGTTPGLAIFPGQVTAINPTNHKVPHIGWNHCRTTSHPMFTDIKDQSYFYFLHSFVVTQTEPRYITATSHYASSFVTAVAKGSLWGTQFHPEKSSTVGLQLLKNFLSQ